MSKKIIIKNSDALKVQNFCEEMGIPYEIEENNIYKESIIAGDFGHSCAGVHAAFASAVHSSYRMKDFLHPIGHDILVAGDIHSQLPNKILLGLEYQEEDIVERIIGESTEFTPSVRGMQEAIDNLTKDKKDNVFHTLEKTEEKLPDDSFYHKIGNQKKNANKRNKFFKNK